MAEPAKLELLTRTPGDTGFLIHEIHSSQAYLQYRPQRLSEDSWEITPQPPSPDGARTYILKNVTRDRYLLLNAKEFFLWEYFDGGHSLEEIARSFHVAFGAFDVSAIRQLLAKMHQAGLLVEPEQPALRRSLTQRKTHWSTRLLHAFAHGCKRISFTLPNADRVSSAVHRYGGFLLFYPISFCLTLLLALLAAIAALQLAPRAVELTRILSNAPLLSTTVMLGAFLAASMTHVFVHALACKAYGRRVREIGFFFLQGVLPTFYADVTDIFMSTRRARVVVDLAGPLVEVVLGSLAFIGAYASEPGFGQALGFATGVLLWEGALINLYPFSFLELDGYHIVADFLALPTLRQQALALAPTLPRRLLNPRAIQRTEWIQVGYLVLCFVSVVVYVILHLDAIATILPAWKR
jgi:putative peptide zinc metalloprotease protein